MKKVNTIPAPTAEDDLRFNAICQSTIQTCGKNLFNEYYKNTNKRWLDIARVWDKVYSCHRHWLLLEAVHKLHWGFYTTDIPDSLQSLLTMIEFEIQSNGEAFHTWISWKPFKNVFLNVVDNITPFGASHKDIDCHFLTHHFYLRSRTVYDLIASKAPVAGIDYAVEDIHDYETVLHRLLPETTTWTKTQWADDLTVSEALLTQYGVDYTECPDSYNRLFELLRIQWCNRDSQDYLWYLMAISSLPDALIKVIWPTNTQRTLEELFLSCWEKVRDYHRHNCPHLHDINLYFNPTSVYHVSFLKDSWLFAYVYNHFGRNATCPDLLKQIKTALFDLSTGY